MSEYMTFNSIGVLRGRNQNERGLFGQHYDCSQKSGTLTFDEIEQAHPPIMDVFLQILSAARFTVATGETLDLSNYIVVATSNIGSQMLKSGGHCHHMKDERLIVLPNLPRERAEFEFILSGYATDDERKAMFWAAVQVYHLLPPLMLLPGGHMQC